MSPAAVIGASVMNPGPHSAPRGTRRSTSWREWCRRLPAWSVAVLLAGLLCPAVCAQLPAEAELTTLQPAEGLIVELFAAEPLVVNPAAIDIDAHGRVWVAEIRYYRSQAKHPPADQIKVLEDTDGDGRADKVTVFADGVFCPMSICVAGPQVFVATSPDLWVFEDRDGDLRADGPPRRLLTGFGGVNHDHGAHSLVLGPDHKWWMSHGDGGFDLTGTDGSRAAYSWGAVLRGELDGSRLETVALNFRNPYEVAVSSAGEAFLSDNDNDGNRSTRICWLLEGGNYGWYGSPPGRAAAHLPYAEGWHFRAHLPGHVPATLVTGFGSPCGMCIYESDAFGPQLDGVALHVDPGPRELRAYRHVPRGYGMEVEARTLLSTAGDPYFRPVDVCAAPDGSLLVADWYDGGVGGHAYDNPDQGRLFRIKPRGKMLRRPDTPGPYRDLAAALAGLRSPNLATQFLAREFLLAHSEIATEALTAWLAPDQNPAFRARAMWVLDRIGPPARDLVREQLAAADPAARALAVRILRRRGDAEAASILPLAADANPEVRREVLSFLRGRRDAASFAALGGLAATYDGSDRYQLEALNLAADGQRDALYQYLAAEPPSAGRLPLLALLAPTEATALALKQLRSAAVPLAERMRLLDTLATIPAQDAGRAVLQLAADPGTELALRRSALDGLARNLAGPWSELAETDGFPDAWRRLLAVAELRATALEVTGRQQWDAFLPEIAALARASGETVENRIAALDAASQLGSPAAAELAEHVLDSDDPALIDAALKALATLGRWSVLEAIVAGERHPAHSQRALSQTLADPVGAIVLWRRLADNGLASDLRARIVAAAADHPDAGTRALFQEAAAPGLRLPRLGAALRPEEILALEGKSERGQMIFFESAAAQCKGCHTIHGRGGTIGPDLSQIGRKYARAALLETILDPSKAIAPEYVPHLAETTDGRLLLGFVVERGRDGVVLRDVQGRLTRLAGTEVAVLEPQQKSLMPELALGDVTAQDAADLLAFLSGLTDQQTPITRARIIGPFNNDGGRAFDRPLPPEREQHPLDLAAQYPGLEELTCRWDEIAARDTTGRRGFDCAAYDRQKGIEPRDVLHYLAVLVDSGSRQEATLTLAGSGRAKVWCNAHALESCGLSPDAPPATMPLELVVGRNLLLIKHEMLTPGENLELSISAPGQLQVRTH